MVFHNNITVPDSECYKYIREPDSGKQEFIVCSTDLTGSKLAEIVSREDFDDSMCRVVAYR